MLYRIMCVVIILGMRYARLLVGVAGHNSDMTTSDYVLQWYCVLVLLLFELYTRVEEKRKGIGFLAGCMLIGLVIIGIVTLIYGLLDSLFICRCFFKDGIGFNFLMLRLPLIISALVLVRLLRDQRRCKTLNDQI